MGVIILIYVQFLSRLIAQAGEAAVIVPTWNMSAPSARTNAAMRVGTRCALQLANSTAICQLLHTFCMKVSRTS